MAKHPHDDLLEKSTMSFGDHIEELRRCLFRGVVGIAIVVGPWIYRLASDLSAERAERVRHERRHAARLPRSEAWLLPRRPRQNRGCPRLRTRTSPATARTPYGT